MPKYYLIICFLFLAVLGHAQKGSKVLITADFSNNNIEEFVRILEQQSHYRFYYNPMQFDSFAVSMKVKAMPLEDVLKAAFYSSDFLASIDNDNQVFITKGTSIVTALPTSGSIRKKDSLMYTKLFDRSAAKNGSKSFANEKVYQIGLKSSAVKEQTAELRVYVISDKTKEPLADLSLTLDGKIPEVLTDSNGVNRLKLTKGSHTLTIKSFGKKTATRHLIVNADGTLPVEMEDEIKVLEDVLVSTQKNTVVNRALLGVEKISIKTIKKVPSVFGEADVLRVILTLPGVKSVGEASTGFNVRGGGTDQNLILFNDATIYNPSHFFGFFSAFNPEIIKDVELFKSSIPAKYGGRLSSVLNITGREGNKNKITGLAGIGLVTSRINIEGPIVKDKTSFNLGARTTYANWLLKLLPDNYKNSAA
ncbi:MAG TPA: TonB-dependent receptor plug domain-containing protein, partial [Segetibacter sp.]